MSGELTWGASKLTAMQVSEINDFYLKMMQRDAAGNGGAPSVTHTSPACAATIPNVGNAGAIGTSVVPNASTSTAASPPTASPFGTPAAGNGAAPAATLSTGGTPATASADRDSKGVVWHADFHAGEKQTNADGTWKRKRGADKALATAYEKQSANSAAINPPAAGGRPPAALVAAPPATMGPTPAEFRALWTSLCTQQRVTSEHETWIRDNYGAHPLEPLYETDGQKRSAVFAIMTTWAAA